MIPINLLKRKIYNHHFVWTFPYDLDLKEELLELGLSAVRKGIGGEWKYIIAPARGIYRYKADISEVIEPTEEVELPKPAPPEKEPELPKKVPPKSPRFWKRLEKLGNIAISEQNQEIITKLEKIEEIEDEGEAMKGLDKVERELKEEEKTYTINFELRDEWSTG